MPITDDRTANLNWPKPSASNNLSDDVIRLRQALDAIDAAVNALAPKVSPIFTGTPAAPTAAADTSTTQLATCAFVIGQAGNVLPLGAGTATAGSSARYARVDHRHPTDTTRAPLASPTFTGTPAAPTAAPGTDTTQLATCAFVLANSISASRQLFAGTGLTGGGDLSANRTFALSAGTLTSLGLADTAVQPARAISAGTGLTGGGNLSADRTLAADFASQAEHEAGTVTNKICHPAGVSQAIDALAKPIKQRSHSSGNLQAGDAGGQVLLSGNCTLAAGAFTLGDAVVLVNNGTTTRTISTSGVTLRQAGSSNTGTRTLGAYGVATILCVGSEDFRIMGAGLL